MRIVHQRILRFTCLVTAVVGIAVLLLSGCFTLTRPPLPKVRGSVVVQGLQDTVEIYRDSAGVAHIIASSDEDLFFAQGFVHAQDRFYQMEFWRRIGAGRLSELFGEAVLPSDIYLRTMGFRRLAEEEYASAPPVLKTALDAYAAGVNAYISDLKPRKLAAEFALLGLQGLDMEIEPWTPLDTLTWPKVMSQDLGADYTIELLRLDVIRAVGITMAQDFFAPYRYEEMPTVIHAEDLQGSSSGAQETNTPEADLALYDNPAWLNAIAGLDLNSTVFEGKSMLVDLTFGGTPEMGSNQWVVSGDFTESGLPQFANDPHLGMQMPSIWYECSLHVTGADGWNCHGYSFAGVPGIVIGHNDNIIWGMSTANPDVQDLYVEQVNPLNPDEYLVGDQWVPMDIRHEVIQINGSDPYFLKIRSTRNGPIVTDQGGAVPYASYDVRPVQIFPTDLRLTELSLKWTALEPTFPLYAVLLYNRAGNSDEFREALTYFHTPSHNYLYADTDGNIGYLHPGNIPDRGQGSGSLPAPGWDDTYQWQGYIPFDELPAVVNPERGYLISANNAVSPDGTQRFSEHLYSPGFRAMRAEELLGEAIGDGTVTMEEHVAIQLDIKSEFASRILPYVLCVDDETIRRNVDLESRLLAPEVKGDDEEELEEIIEARISGAQLALDILAAWDLMMDADSLGAVVFAQFYVDLCEKTYVDQLPSDVWNGPWKAASGYRLQNSLWLLADDPANQWWDDARTPDVQESRDDIIARALGSSFEKLEEQLGDNSERWTWGELHTATFENATLGSSGIGFIERIFNSGPVEVSGGLNVLRRADFKVQEPFAVYHITSMRMIADLADWSSALYIYSPGQSGHPASGHYDDMVNMWVEGEYYTHPWTLDEIRDQGRDRLMLTPTQ